MGTFEKWGPWPPCLLLPVPPPLPQKVALTKSKSCAKLVAEVVQKIWKSCAKVARNLAHFGCKMLL